MSYVLQIVCLQEVEEDDLETFWLPRCRRAGTYSLEMFVFITFRIVLCFQILGVNGGFSPSPRTRRVYADHFTSSWWLRARSDDSPPSTQLTVPRPSTGYQLVFKKRTGNDKVDGCAVMYREAAFALQEAATVEYHQPGCKALDRDNVGIVVRLR